MFFTIQDLMNGLSGTASTIISVALMLFCGFLMTRITKLFKLPNVTAYIIVGLILGQLNIINDSVIDGMDFIADIAIAFIAFASGEFLRINVIKESGFKTIIITAFEALIPFILIFILTYLLLGLSLPFALVISSLASATTATSTMMNIRQTNSKGPFVNTLLQVIAIDNIIALLIYSIAMSIANTILSNVEFNFWVLIKPVITNIGVLLVGGGFGFLLKLFISSKRSNDNRLIIAIATLFAFCGICALLDISPVLGCMSMGLVYINISNDERLFKQLNYFSPPILLLFFVRSGVSFDVTALGANGSFGSLPLIVITILYFVIRIIGKISGATLGCLICKKDKQTTKYLGLAMIPQTSIAISLATLAARTFNELGFVDEAVALHTVIVAAALLFEVVGPICSKLALYLTHSYSNDIDTITNVNVTEIDGTKKNDVQILIDRIKEIQNTIPEHDINEEEQAYDEAIEEQLNNYYGQINYRNRNWRRK